MKQEKPSPWPPKAPAGKIDANTPNGCDYVDGEKITSSWDKRESDRLGPKGNARSR